MGDRRFVRLYDRVRAAEDSAAVIRGLTDEQVVSALAATTEARDPYMANVLATEAHNRLAQRERLEGALREGEERFRLIARSMQDVVWDWDLRTGTVWRSGGYERAFGYDPEAVDSTPEWWEERLHPGDRERVLRCEREWLSGGAREWQAEYRFRRADGDYSHVLENGYVVRDCSGEPVRAVGVIVDLTERRRREEALRQQEAFQRTSLQALSDLGGALLVYDGERVVHVNPAVERVTGYTAEELNALPDILDVVAPEDRDRVRDSLTRRLRGEAAPERMEFDVFRKDGGRITVSASGGQYEVGGELRVIGIFTDVTERRRQEAAVRESEARHRKLFENVPMGLYRTTPDGEYLDANPALIHAYGFESLEDLQRANAAELYADPGDRAKWRRILEREGAVHGHEVRTRRRDGATIWVRDHARVVRDAEGRIQYFEGAVEDITERKRAEAALKEAHRSLQGLVDAAPEPIIAVDRDLVVTMWNPAAERVFGWRADEVIGEYYPIVPEGRWDEHVGLHGRVLEGEGLRDVETQRVRKDGALVDVSISTAPLRGSDGEVSGGMVVVRDISERKRQEEALRESEHRYRTLFENVPVGLYRTTPGGVLIDANQALVDIMGYPSVDAILGISAAGFYVDPADRERWRGSMERHGVTRDFEVELRRHDGATVWTRESARAVRDARGDLKWFEGAVEDITERKRAEEEVRRLNRKLEARVAERTRSLKHASRALEEYDHRVGHDLRARLRAVDFLSEVLIEDHGEELAGEASEFLQRLRGESVRLTQSVNELLEMRRADRSPATR